MNDHEDLIRRLSCPSRTEQRMTMWDSWRKAIADGERGSWPRDSFEAVLDDIDEERIEASTAIKELVAECDRLMHAAQEDDLARRKAEADLAAAREALSRISRMADSEKMAEAAAIAATRGEHPEPDVGPTWADVCQRGSDVCPTCGDTGVVNEWNGGHSISCPRGCTGKKEATR